MNNQQNKAFQQFQNEVSIEFERVFLNWDDTLHEWHKWATYALKFASPKSTGVQQQNWSDLFEEPKNGLNLNVVSTLCNNIVAMSEHDMEVDRQTYLMILKMNETIVKRWYKLANPIQDSVSRRIQLMQAGGQLGNHLKVIPKD